MSSKEIISDISCSESTRSNSNGNNASSSERVYTLDEIKALVEEGTGNNYLKHWPVDTFLWIGIGGTDDTPTNIKFHRTQDTITCHYCSRAWDSSLVDKGSINASNIEAHAKSHDKDFGKRKKVFADDTCNGAVAKQPKLITSFFRPAAKVETAKEKPRAEWTLEDYEKESEVKIQKNLEKLESIRSAVRVHDENNTLPEGCPNRRFLGNGGIKECDGCCQSLKKLARLDGMEVRSIEIDMKVCPRCYYAACGHCSCHHSRGTCYCKDSNFGWTYPVERAWYHGGRW